MKIEILYLISDQPTRITTSCWTGKTRTPYHFHQIRTS